MPASPYCPMRSTASDTALTKPGDDPRGTSRSRLIASTVASRASSQRWTWVREPVEAVPFGPLRLCLGRFKDLGGAGGIEPGRVVNAELHLLPQ